MILSAFLDESERKEQSEPISVAGYVFKPTGYRHFVRKWERMLRSGGPKPTTHFHMTHLYARSHEYDGWSPAERAEYLRQAVDAVNKHSYCGISVMFGQKDFEQLAPPIWRFERGSIYAGACPLALRVTAYWMDKQNCHTPIRYAFESGHRFWDEADDILGATGEHAELKRLYRYHSHAAVGKKEAYGLQAADMLAWLMTKLEVGITVNHTMSAFAPVIMSLAENRSNRYQLFHPDRKKLKDFFDEQMSMEPPVVVTLSRPKSLRLR